MMQKTYGTMNAQMRLYDERNQRLYVNAVERECFLAAANQANPNVKALCLTLFYTGCRLSEALEVTVASVQPQSRLISFRTLKKRDKHEVREVPMPPVLADTLAAMQQVRFEDSGGSEIQNLPLWTHKGRPLNRITGYRWVKNVMKNANIIGKQASPKGLRHGYGVHAMRSGVQLNMLKKWMGHASMVTTAIYANAIGEEELEIADRMWR